ncbi:amino acid ABC transporter permease [Tumebacillus flagellatus]|uniref:Glutamine ABC transporter permease n=1 Tax=Tumebacillus flagellatus TaxID=1157490 RepID=A0A074MG40_9BACL|nr:amino acid ABC transporter permease [Tumebacillus flagellatus]KEO84667.1 glutamine ABC transporter permease [Tumebacillus flagellatus]
MDFAGALSPANLKYMMHGLGVTLEVAVWSIVLSFLLANLIAVLRYARIPVLSQILFVFVEIVRNLPLLLIIFFMFFAVPDVLKINITPIQAAIAALTIFESAMISEIIRGGLNSIPKGQIEAGRSSGLTYVQTLRYIVLPQALRKMVPPLVSQFISLLKDTSLAIIISLEELLRTTQIVYSQKMSYVFPALIFAALVYFVINYSLSLVAGRLEKRFNV